MRQPPVGAVIGATAAAYCGVRANAIAAFWIAYILIRPPSAAFGDWLSQPVVNSGLGWSTLGTSAVFFSAILALVANLSLRRKTQAA